MSNLYKSLVRIEVARLFPSQLKGRPRVLAFDEAFDGIFRVVQTGMPWRHLRPPTVAAITVFKTMHRWLRADVFRTAYQRLLRLHCRRRRPRYYCIDSSYVKSMYGRDCVGRNPTDRGRRATKLSVVVDDVGMPHALLASPANVSDQRLLQPTLQAMLSPPHRGSELFADKGYDSAANRRTARAFGFNERIFKRRTHAKRGVVERYFSWQDKCRRLLVRYEQQVATYVALTILAAGMRLGRCWDG